MLAERFGLGGQDRAVRAQLARSLYARPMALAVGGSCGVAAGVTVLSYTVTDLLRWCALAMIVLAAARVIMAQGAHRLHNRLGDWLRATYIYGALSYAVIVGLTASAALLQDQLPAHVQVLMTCYAVIFGTGLALGNAGRPVVALGQMALTLLPIVVTCMAIGTLPLVILGLILPSMTAGLSFITLNVFRMLANQARAARDSADLAAQMHRQAMTDPITGLGNRAGFELAGSELLAQRPDDALTALFWLDLHRFKEVNDVLGHQVGDGVLSLVAERLYARTPRGAALARFGSDEFLILGHFAARAEVEALAAALTEDLAKPLRVRGHRIESGAAIGVALLGEDAGDIERLMQNAGLALYHAKALGRHQTCYFDQSMTRQLARRREIEAELRAAIQRDELSIYFQPIVDLATGRIRAFEALVRWFHPDKGELLPDEFIPVAEDTGLIITLGNWITRTAARAAAKWPDDVTLAVNLSPVQIKAPGAALGILAALRDAGLDPGRLELEVTENLFVDDDAATATFMDQLAQHGVHFALDDFGTGYSSLGYINRYPFRTIKVDRSFVSGPDIGLRSDAIIRAVAEMGTTLGMDIVAEGLETIEQVNAVRRAGCTLGQGYHFSRAVPEHLAQHLLAEDRQGTGSVRQAG